MAGELPLPAAVVAGASTDACYRNPNSAAAVADDWPMIGLPGRSQRGELCHLMCRAKQCSFVRWSV